MKEALITKGTEFAGRPQDPYINDTTQHKGTTRMICGKADITDIHFLKTTDFYQFL